MNNSKNFNHLVLLIGTNPLPNFVAADYYLSINQNIKQIWLIHSEENRLQAGTDKQAENLEALLRKRWEGNHHNLDFPLEKISLSDVSDAATIFREIEMKMLSSWHTNESFHLNYTGGTKAMATHVYRLLQKKLHESDQQHFSYLDANNFRLVIDNYGIERFEDENGVETYDLRQKVHLGFEDLITLHGFHRINKDKGINIDLARLAYSKFIDTKNYPTMNSNDGLDFEAYLYSKINDELKDKQKNSIRVYHDWLIKKSTWSTKFQLDVMVVNGYHLTGISCTVSCDKDVCKCKGFEIILRTRQIGGDEAGSILITRADRAITQRLQNELSYETGGQENILVLGVEDFLREDLYLNKIEKFILD